MVKLLGERFTLLGPESPVGAFFEAMSQTGVYWNFLGLGQVTAAVLLAGLFLLCWDYDRFKTLLFAPRERPPTDAAPAPAAERWGYGLGGAAALAVLLATRGLFPTAVVPWMVVVGVLGALLVLVGWIQATVRAHGLET